MVEIPPTVKRLSSGILVVVRGRAALVVTTHLPGSDSDAPIEGEITFDSNRTGSALDRSSSGYGKIM